MLGASLTGFAATSPLIRERACQAIALDAITPTRSAVLSRVDRLTGGDHPLTRL